jgi:dTMP kinase
MTTGRFISIEGGEGAGKSTQAARLAARLREAGHAVVTTREPGGTPGAEAIRALLVTGEAGRWHPMTETLLHVAARHDHVERLIRPALARGDWVVCDRFADSTLAYQGYGLQLGVDAVRAIQVAALGDFMPDLTLILRFPVKHGLARSAWRDSESDSGADSGAKTIAEDRYERMDEAFHDRVLAGFAEIAKREPERCVEIDAGGSVEAVAAAIAETVSARLGVAL